MNALRTQYAIPVGALVFSLSIAVLWMIAPQFVAANPGIRWSLLAATVALSITAVVLADRRAARGQQAVCRHFDALCRLNSSDLSARIASNASSAFDAKSPWYEMYNRVSQRLGGCAEEVQQAEHAKAAAEIRAQRLAQRQLHLESILAGFPDPVIAVDEYEELVLANPSAEAMFQFDGQNAERRALAELVRCESLVQMLSDARRRKLPSTRSGEIQLAAADGEPRWYRVTAQGLAGKPVVAQSSDGGEVSHGAVAVLRDISGQRALQKRNAEFVSAVSHEMKTPLAGIKAYVELLVDGDDEDEATREEFLHVINSQADRLQRLIDNMLNLARIEAGVVNVNKEPQSLNELLDQSLSIVQPAADQKRITLLSDLSNMYLGVVIDRDTMMQAAINLLSNAIKYTPAGGKVTLRSRSGDNQAQFSVDDNGVGLSEEDCVNVFNKFYRVKKDSGMAAGTGLGLPLAKHIVEDVHSGRLTVQSKLGAGSTFTVTLPTAGQLHSVGSRESRD